MQAPFVDLSVGALVMVLPAHDVPGERKGCARFITSDFLRGQAGQVLVEWPNGDRDWIAIRRVPSACDRRIGPIPVEEVS